MTSTSHLPALERSLSRPHIALGQLLLAGHAGATIAMGWVATHEPLITGVVAGAVIAAGVALSRRWWRDYDVTTAEWVYYAVVAGVAIGASVNGHIGWALAVAAGSAVLFLITGLDPDWVADQIAHSRWTPGGAAGHATAVAAWDAIHRLRELRLDPRYDGATVDELLNVFTTDRCQEAATAVGEDLYAARDVRRDDLVCLACGSSNTHPCPLHTPRLYAAYLDDQAQRWR